jgi:hypothetical protein
MQQFPLEPVMAATSKQCQEAEVTAAVTSLVIVIYDIEDACADVEAVGLVMWTMGAIASV